MGNVKKIAKRITALDWQPGDQVPGRTTGFTPEQIAEINEVLAPIISNAVKQINSNAKRIMEMDKRPQQTRTDEQPDVFMPYVAKGMLEDLIAELQELV